MQPFHRPRGLIGSISGALVLGGLIILIALSIVISATFALDQLRERTRAQIAEQLHTLNSQVIVELHRLLEQMAVTASQLVHEPAIFSLLNEALVKPDTLKSQETRLTIRKHLAQQIFLFHYDGFYLIDRNHRIVLGMKDADEGKAVPYGLEQVFFQLVRGESAVVTPPFERDKGMAIWVIAPLRDSQHRVVGFLALETDGNWLSSVTSNAGRFMETGETYLINADGLMLSTSRFNQDMVRLGRLHIGETATLKLKVTVPGEQEQLTHAAEMVLHTHQTGFSSHPYIGYRGDLVYGAWYWDPRLKAGVITEVAASEADELFNHLRDMILVLLSVIFLLAVIFLMLLFFYGRRRLLHEKEVNRLREMFLKSTAEAIYGLDSQGKCTFVNQACQQLLGYSEEELIGRHMHDLIHHSRMNGERYPVEQCPIYRSFRERTRVYCDDEIFWRKDGRPIEVEYWAHPVFEGNQVVGSVVTFWDITERRRVEREMQEVEKKMQHTQRLESLGVLAGGIAHDFNNILAAILGNAFLAKNNLVKDPLKAKERIDLIIQSSEKAASLCKQMLAYSGKGQFIVRPLDLSKVVEEITHLLDVSIGKSVTLKYHLSRGLPPVMADEAQMQQIIMNLITNANEAIGENVGVISLTTGVMEADSDYLDDCFGDNPQPGHYVYLEVSDTGCGMDAETIERIFDPFFTTKTTGQGLGLSAVLGIVRGHRGALKIYSEPGRGSTFKLLLPAEEGLSDISVVEEPTRIVRFSGGLVLVVDDEDSVRETARSMLEEMGFETLEAGNGREGIRVFRKHRDRIILVLTDLTMPEMDGKELFSQIRRMAPNCPVILTSGYNSQDAIQQFAGKGLAGFIQKPFSPMALSREIEKVFGKQEHETEHD